jgi:hypothetical protein
MRTLRAAISLFFNYTHSRRALNLLRAASADLKTDSGITTPAARTVWEHASVN